MKILHINSYFSAGFFYKHLYDHQIKQGIDIAVYVPTAKCFKERTVYPKYADIDKCYTKVDRYLYFPKHKKIFNSLIKKHNIKEFDLTHAHSLLSNGLISYWIYKKYKIPYIVAVRNTDINFFLKKIPLLRFLARKIVRNAEKVVFISPSYKEEAIEKYFGNVLNIINKATVIPNGINHFWLNNINSHQTIPIMGQALKIITIGNINKNKNQLSVCKALDLLEKKGIDCAYTIIGETEDKTYFNEIKKYKFVRYINYQPKEKVLKELHNNDIFIMPSFNETFGLVYAEAMSQGLPVIYTKGQGFDRQFDEGVVGYHVVPDSSEDIVNKIKLILDNYEKISKNCLKKVDKFDWEKVAKDYSGLYDTVIRR